MQDSTIQTIKLDEVVTGRSVVTSPVSGFNPKRHRVFLHSSMSNTSLPKKVVQISQISEEFLFKNGKIIEMEFEQ